MNASSGKMIQVCSHCGSPDLVSDAAAKWSVDLQQWILVDVHDGTFCEACEGECRVTDLALEEFQGEYVEPVDYNAPIPAVMTPEEIRARIAREVEEHQFFQSVSGARVANPVSSAQDNLDQRMGAQSKAALARKPGEKCGQEGCSVCDPQEDV